MEPAPFNAIACSYDHQFTQSKVGILQRSRVWKNLQKYLTGNNRLSILEINCGTGVDACWLCERGHQVVATDVSEKMINEAIGKRESANHNLPEFLVCDYRHLHNRFQSGSFDMIFSNFGGINCVEENSLKILNKHFSDLLRTGGRLILVVLGKKCWMERIYFLLRGKFSQVFRRNKMEMAELGNGVLQPVYYYTVKEIGENFSRFDMITAKPIGIAIPPSYLNGWLNKLPFLVPVIQFLESVLGNITFISDYADHTFIVLRKK